MNAAAFTILLMSGLMIFNAHPRLYWGEYGANDDKAWLEIGDEGDKGYLSVGGARIETTGVLGRWRDKEGVVRSRAFPGWATIPRSYSLAGARRWHLFFAWIFVLGGLAYWLASALNGHLSRDLAPTGEELRPRHILKDIVDHARLRFPTGEAALKYNVLQKLSYLTVLFVLFPLMVLTGLTMSPNMDAAWGWLLDLFGGRQSARSLHFISATLFVAFILVHLTMVVLAGPWNEVRSMITGKYRPPRERLR